ncbi:MAG: hypothetical protein ACK5QX_11085 [bacterium]
MSDLRVTFGPDAANENNRRMFVDGSQWAKVYGWDKASVEARCDTLAQALARRDGVEERVVGYRARQSFGRWIVERELPCINGLSAWFAICSVPEPDEQEIGYSEGACGSAEENAKRIAAALSAHPAPTAPGDGEARSALMAAQSFIADGGHAETEPGASVYRQVTAALRQPDTAGEGPFNDQRDFPKLRTATPSTAEDASMAGGEECPDCDTSGRCTFVCETTPADPRPDLLEALREARAALEQAKEDIETLLNGPWCEAEGSLEDWTQSIDQALANIKAVMGEAG